MLEIIYLFKNKLWLGILISILLHAIILHAISPTIKLHEHQNTPNDAPPISISITNPEIDTKINSINTTETSPQNLSKKNNTTIESGINKNPYIVGEWHLDTSSWPPGTRRVISIRIFLSALGTIDKWDLLSEPDPLVLSALNSISKTVFNPKYKNGFATASEVHYEIEVVSE